MFCGLEIFKTYQTLFSKKLTQEENSILHTMGTSATINLSVFFDTLQSTPKEDTRINEILMVLKEINKNDSAAIQNIDDLFSKLIGNPTSERSAAASSVPVDPEPPETKFFPLKSNLRNTTIRDSINPKIKIIECLSQGNSSASCGAHALKNAMLALGISRGWITEENFSFCDNKFYREVNGFIRFKKDNSDDEEDYREEDLTEEDLIGAWVEANMNQFFLDSEGIPFVQNEIWDKEGLSFFQTGNSGLTIQNADGLDYLLNLKALIQKPAPCCHAFMIGHRGHWSTLFFEKDRKGIITWYEIDSLVATRNKTRVHRLVEWIEEAMDNIDHFSLQLHDKFIGQPFREYIAQIKKEESLEFDSETDPLDLIFQSIDFMKYQGWLVNPPQNLIIADTLNNINTLLAYHREQHIAEKETARLQKMISHIDAASFPSFSPLELEIELFKAHLPFGETADSLLSEFLQLPEEVIPKIEFLRFLNKHCDNDERTVQLKFALFLFQFGYAPLFHRAFTYAPETEREENWKILVDLHSLGLVSSREDAVLIECKRILNNEQGHAQSSSSSFGSSLGGINPLLRQMQHREWLNGNLESIQNRLFSESKPYAAKRLALEIVSLQYLFYPHGQVDLKLIELIRNAQWTITKTSQNDLEHPFASWNFYENLKLIQKNLNPIKHYIEYHEKSLEFTPSVFMRENYTRADLSPRVNPQTVKTLFDNLETRINSYPKLAIEATTVAGDVSNLIAHELQNPYSNGEELELIYAVKVAMKKFKDFKNRFFQDSFIARFMEIPEEINSGVSEETYLFYSLIEDCLNRSSIPTHPSTLSDQERYFYYYCNAIDGCPTGKRAKMRNLCQIYLPKDSQKVESRGSRHPLFDFFLPLYDSPIGFQTVLKSFFTRVNGARRYLRHDFFDGKDLTHYEEFFRNSLSNRLGYKRQVTFDWHSHLIDQNFYNWCLKVVYGQDNSYLIDISRFLCSSLPGLLDEISTELNGTLLINARLVQVVNRYNKARSQYVLGLTDESQFREVKMSFLEEKNRADELFENGSLWTQIEAVPLTLPLEGEAEGPEHREPKYRIENLYDAILDLTRGMNIPVTDIFKFEYDEEAPVGEDMKAVGIKEEAFLSIGEALGVISRPQPKLTIQPNIDRKELDELIRENKYITELDLSLLEKDPTTISLMVEALPRFIKLKKLNLRNLSSISQEILRSIINTEKEFEIDLRGCREIKTLLINRSCRSKIIHNKDELEIILVLNRFTYDQKSIVRSLKINPECKIKILWTERYPIAKWVSSSIERVKNTYPSLEIIVEKTDEEYMDSIS